ncbi:MAG: response regulator [Spirochaetaceae bacterium]|jgi:two-component system response regulator YesN|nr:response regulator [Spirochaetaceae bacterium]
MKKILLVDDEYIVRLGLKTIVDWAAFGYAVAGEAANGREAFDFFEKNPVDVILTDIKMPVMDGIELTRRVRERNKKTQIIILSHYDEFSYAQEAINLGAFRYILKSELTKTNLENTLKSLYLDSGLSPETEQKAGWKENLEGFIEKHLLPSFNRLFKDEREEQHIRLPESAFPPGAAGGIVLFSVSCRTTPLSSEAREKFPKTIAVLFEDTFAGLAGAGEYYGDNFYFAAIAPQAAIAPFAEPKNADAKTFFAEKVSGPALQLVKNVRRYYDVNLFIGASSVGKPDEYRRLLREAHQARRDCFFSQKVFVGVFDAGSGGRENKNAQKSVQISYTRLVELIGANQKNAMLEYIQTIFRELRESGSYSAVYGAFVDFLSAGKLIHEKYQLEEEASLSGHKFKHDAFFDLPFIGDVEMYIYELYLSLLYTKQNGKAGYSHIVKRCIEFIEREYEHNIGLAEAAEYAGVSHSYLSFIFKQETGVNFNAALARRRIEKAKKLLASTSLKIYEVAEKTGFSNPYYFSKVFREIAGCTCKEYRALGGK